ncbi:MAG TPA: hypothetical protein VNA68_00145 [Candidatus Dormibacteraeota bacterium]|nr:hypothetical protein [Candidatus Dormibacteraeota bacterium]
MELPQNLQAAEDNTHIKPVTWQASEYVFHEKPTFWYLSLILIMAALAAVLAYFQQWFSVAVVAVMTLALFMYSKKAPRTLNYQVDEHGITVEGKLYPYNQFRSYGVLQEVAWRSIDLEPSRRFMPRLTLICENDNFESIGQVLAAHLPRADRKLDMVERLSRYMRF